jgi:hypothetical protein
MTFNFYGFQREFNAENEIEILTNVKHSYIGKNPVNFQTHPKLSYYFETG